MKKQVVNAGKVENSTIIQIQGDYIGSGSAIPDFDWEKLALDMNNLVKQPVYGIPHFNLEDIFVFQEADFKLSGSVGWEDIGHLGDYVEDFEFDRLKNDQRPLILYGDFGVGKSSFLKMLSHRLHHSSSGYIPIFVPLKELPLYDNANVVSAIKSYLNIYGDFRIDKLDRKVLFLFDGFDEFNFYSNEKEWVAKRFNQLIALLRYPNVHIVISARPILFLKNDKGLPHETPILRVREFNRDQVSQWLEKWKRIEPNKDSGISLESLSERNLGEITKNPLLLFLTAGIFDEELQEKRNYSRGMIYKLFYDWTIRGKFKADGQAHNIPSNYREVLRNIAVTIFNFGSGGEFIEFERLQSLIREQQNAPLEQDFFNNIETTILVAHFFKIKEEGDKKLKYIEFSHKSFREYLIAEKFYEFFRESFEKKSIDDEKWFALGRILPMEESINFLKDLLFSLPDDELRWIYDQLFVRSHAISKPTQFDKLLEGIADTDEIKEFNSVLLKSSNLSVWSYILLILIYTGFKEQLKIKTYHSPFASLNYHFCSSRTFAILSKTSYPQNWPLIKKYLDQLTLSGANLSHIDLSYASLEGAILEKTEIGNASFTKAKLNKVVISDCKFHFVSLDGSKCHGTHFIKSSFRQVSFEKAEFIDAEFKDVDFVNADFSSAVLENCIFENCSFRNVIWDSAKKTNCKGILGDVI